VCTTILKCEKAAKNLNITVFTAAFSFVNCQSREILDDLIVANKDWWPELN
jgi:alpha-galactosidase/6-phospho-beta-glucosidase family protein